MGQNVYEEMVPSSWLTCPMLPQPVYTIGFVEKYICQKRKFNFSQQGIYTFNNYLLIRSTIRTEFCQINNNLEFRIRLRKKKVQKKFWNTAQNQTIKHDSKKLFELLDKCRNLLSLGFYL